ncbi:hypothetical protein EDD15DRAFT_2396349 [Pisolithus albus]|nr:hypothetical protein EDD15DRAFT_2396349 [Pisolithus albus]
MTNAFSLSVGAAVNMIHSPSPGQVEKTPSEFILSPVPLLTSSDPLHEPDAFAIALAYPFTYQLDYIQPRIPSDPPSSTGYLQLTSFIDEPAREPFHINDFAAQDNMGISPLSSSASGWNPMTSAASSISTPDLVHIETTLPTTSQVLSPPPQRSDMSGLGEQRQQPPPLRPLS